MPRNLLVSGIGKRNHLLRLIADECAEQGAVLIGADAVGLAPARAAVERFELLPPALDPDFGARYGEVLARQDVGAFITIIDPEIAVLGQLAGQGALDAARFLQPTAESSMICEDKLTFHQVLSARGVPTVPTYASPLESYPFIRKDRAGSAASGFQVFSDPTDLSAHEDLTDHDSIFQPFCAGQHYCVDAYFSLSEGTLVDLCVKEVLAKRDGESYLLRSFPREGFVDLLRHLSGVLPLRGIVNIDVWDIEGELAVMEVNPRIGGNYPAAHAFGVNLLRHMTREGLGEIDSKPSFSPYEPGLLVSKFIGFSDPFWVDPTG